MNKGLNKILLLILDAFIVYFLFVGMEYLPAQFSTELKFVIIMVLMAFLLIPSITYWLDIKW